MNQSQLLAALRGPAERIVHDPPHTERRVHADLGGDLVRCAHPDRATSSRVRPLGAFADDDEIDVGVSGERTAHPRIKPGWSQIDVMVELEPDPQQQTAFQHAAGHRRIADRAEQDRVVCAQFVEHGIGQHLAAGVVSPRSQVVARLLYAGHHGVEHFDGLADHLRTDAVTSDDRQFHDPTSSESPTQPTQYWLVGAGS